MSLAHKVTVIFFLCLREQTGHTLGTLDPLHSFYATLISDVWTDGWTSKLMQYAKILDELYRQLKSGKLKKNAKI